ncbi:hypothetical protein IAR50_006083 [Cryptococcus sp. DSM 104548]
MRKKTTSVVGTQAKGRSKGRVYNCHELEKAASVRELSANEETAGPLGTITETLSDHVNVLVETYDTFKSNPAVTYSKRKAFTNILDQIEEDVDRLKSLKVFTLRTEMASPRDKVDVNTDYLARMEKLSLASKA